MNQAIELHDSRVTEVVRAGDAVTVRLAPAYLHRSEGKPGWDRGTGWVQSWELVFSGATVVHPLGELPQELDHGWLWLGDQRFDDLLPLPLDHTGKLRFSGITLGGEQLLVVADSVSAGATDNARYVEDFAGCG